MHSHEKIHAQAQDELGTAGGDTWHFVWFSAVCALRLELRALSFLIRSKCKCRGAAERSGNRMLSAFVLGASDIFNCLHESLVSPPFIFFHLLSAILFQNCKEQIQVAFFRSTALVFLQDSTNCGCQQCPILG